MSGGRIGADAEDHALHVRARPRGAGSVRPDPVGLSRARARSAAATRRALRLALPAADQVLDRLQRASEQDRGGDHDSGRGIARRSRARPPDASIATCSAWRVMRAAAASRRRSCAEPSPARRATLRGAPASASTAARVMPMPTITSALRSKRRRDGCVARAPRSARSALARASVASVSTPRPASSTALIAAVSAEQRMHQADHQQVDRQPGRVEQRLDAAAAQEGAQLRDIAQRVGVRPARRDRPPAAARPQAPPATGADRARRPAHASARARAVSMQ